MTNISSRKRNLFTGTVVHSASDDMGDILVVDHRYHRSLTFYTIYEQSGMDLRKPHLLIHEYTNAMMMVLAFIKPQHATILGLGGGSLLRSLHYILPACKLHAVELRQQVYEIADKFFGIPKVDHIKITISDAQLLMHEAQSESTDIIFTDLYLANSMISLQVQQDFVTECHRVLSEDGWLVINYHQMPDLSSSFFTWVCTLFPEVFTCKTSAGNFILFAGKKTIDSLPPDDAIAALEQKLETRLMPLFKRLTSVKI